MKRRAWPRAVLAALVVALASSSALSVPEPAAPGAAQELDAQDLEREVLLLLTSGKLISARTKAEQLIAINPGSYVGHFVLGTALRDADGALARAMRELELARAAYERLYRPGDRDAPWQMHVEILRGMEYTALLMEDFRLELRLLDEHDAFYSPKLRPQRAWPLMKLGRYAEAREIAKATIDDASAPYRSTALNALCVVESEAHRREAANEACVALLEYGRNLLASAADPTKVSNFAVYANNAALSSLTVLRHDEAEKQLLEGVTKTTSSSSNPWRHLVELYVLEGRMAEALSAVGEMQRWRARQSPELRDQDKADIDAAVALLLLAAGDADKGLFFANRALARPDRRGMTSSNPDQSMGAHALVRHALNKLKAELASETLSLGGPVAERTRAASALLAAGVSRTEDRERLVGVMREQRTLNATLRMYLDGGLDYVPTWLLGDLVEVLGPAVVNASLVKAREAEAVDNRRSFIPFYDALEAEVKLARGQNAAALALVRGALDTLPRAEVIFTARAAAIGAEAARRAGDMPASLSLFERAYSTESGVLRRLGLALPARIEAAGDARSQKAASMLRNSPRLMMRRQGFVVRVEPEKVCLASPSGSTLACVDAPQMPEGLTTDEAARRLVAHFHDRAFGLRQGTDGMDLRSLDGSTTIDDLERDRLRLLIDDVTGG